MLRKIAAPVLTALALSLCVTLTATAQDSPPAPAPNGLDSYVEPPQRLHLLHPGERWRAPLWQCPDSQTTLAVFKWNGDGGFVVGPHPGGIDGFRYESPDLSGGVNFDASTNRFRNLTSVPVIAAFWCNA